MSNEMEKITSIVNTQRAFFLTDKTLDTDFRIRQLKRLRTAVVSHENELKKALAADLGRSPLEAYFCDIGSLISLLPVVPFRDDDINDLLNEIAKRERGLAMYLFTKDIAWAQKTMQRMQFGGGCINEVCLHMMVRGVPFNGVGHSGMGAYHGEWGFREFTHPQSVLIGSTRFNLPMREHPYDKKWKDKLIHLFEK